MRDVISERRVCLVMPFRNEARHLSDVLASLAAQTVDRSALRLIAVDSGSSDDGAEIVLHWLQQTGINGEIVRVERPGIPAALNAGNARARPDEIVVRLDAHSLYEPRYLQTILDAMDALGPDAWWVGGSIVEPVAASFADRVVRALMTNPAGLGASPWRSSTTMRRIRGNAYLGAFRPGVLARVGGYDERWTANEDAELAARIEAAGGQIWFVPVRCSYRINRSPWRTIAQWYRYGFWRARTIRRHPATLRPRHLAPPLAAVLAVALAISPWRLALVPLAALFAVLVVARRERAEGALVTAASVAYFPAVHAAFAAGLLSGWLTSARRSAWAPCDVRAPASEGAG